MARKFTRNITGTTLRGENKEPLHTNKQNDLLSDEEDAFIRNNDDYHCLTDNIKEITSPNIIVNRIDKNTVELISNGEGGEGGEFIPTTITVKENSKEYLEVINPKTNHFELGLKEDFINSFDYVKNIIENLPDMSNYYNKEEIDRIINDWHGSLENVQSDWNETDTSDDAYIKNKPTIPDMNDYYDKEEVDEKIGEIDTDFNQKQADWNETDSDNPSFIQNKPTIPEAPDMSDYYDKEEVDEKVSGIGRLSNKDRASIINLNMNLEDRIIQFTAKRNYTVSEIKNMHIFIGKSNWTRSNNILSLKIVNSTGLVRNKEQIFNYNLADNNATNKLLNNVQTYLDNSQEKVVRVPVFIRYETVTESREYYTTKDNITMLVYRKNDDMPETPEMPDMGDYYNKEEVDDKISEIDIDFNQKQADWNETNEDSDSFIKNKPTIPEIPEIPDMNDYYNKSQIDAKFDDIDTGGDSETEPSENEDYDPRVVIRNVKYNLDDRMLYVQMFERLSGKSLINSITIHVDSINIYKDINNTSPSLDGQISFKPDESMSGLNDIFSTIGADSDFEAIVNSYVKEYSDLPFPLQIPIYARYSYKYYKDETEKICSANLTMLVYETDKKIHLR